MSAIKGFPTSDKIVSLDQGGVKNDYVTLQPTGAKRVSLDTVNRGVYQVTAGLIVAAGSGNVPGGAPRIITTAPHGAQEGNLIRFTAGALTGVETAVTKIINPTTLEIGMYVPPTVVGSTFTLLRYVTQALDASGGIAVGAPVGGATEAKQDAAILELQAIKNNTAGLASLDVKASSRLDYAVTNVTTGAWTQIIATVGALPIKEIQIFESGGYTMQLGTGAAGAEVVRMLINPGGNGRIPIAILAGIRVAIRSVVQPTINNGEIVVNYLG